MTLHAKYQELIQELQAKYPDAKEISVTKQGVVLTKTCVTTTIFWREIDKPIDFYQLAQKALQYLQGPKFDQLGPLRQFIDDEEVIHLYYNTKNFNFSKEFLLDTSATFNKP